MYYVLGLLIPPFSLIKLATNLDPVDYVDLPIIDLANFESAESRALLTTKVLDALLTHGFFYVVGHGYRQSEARSSSPSCYSDDQQRNRRTGYLISQIYPLRA
jgi:hypothetical protein